MFNPFIIALVEQFKFHVIKVKVVQIVLYIGLSTIVRDRMTDHITKSSALSAASLGSRQRSSIYTAETNSACTLCILACSSLYMAFILVL